MSVTGWPPRKPIVLHYLASSSACGSRRMSGCTRISALSCCRQGCFSHKITNRYYESRKQSTLAYYWFTLKDPKIWSQNSSYHDYRVGHPFKKYKAQGTRPGAWLGLNLAQIRSLNTGPYKILLPVPVQFLGPLILCLSAQLVVLVLWSTKF